MPSLRNFEVGHSQGKVVAQSQSRHSQLVKVMGDSFESTNRSRRFCTLMWVDLLQAGQLARLVRVVIFVC